MLQHVAVAGERVAEVLRKLFYNNCDKYVCSELT